MADLTDLFSVAPMTAGMNLGALLDNQRQKETLQNAGYGLDNTAKQQEIAQTTLMNPLKVDAERLKNQGTGLDNDSKATANKKSAGTVDTEIAAGNAKNNSEVTKAHIDQANHLFDTASQAAMRGGNNPMLRSFIFKQNGYDPNDPSVSKLLNMSPQDIMAGANAVKQHELDFNAQYQGTRYTADQHLKGQEGNNAATVKAAQIAADARVNTAKLRSTGGADFWSNFYKTHSTAGKYGLLNAEAAKLEDGGEPEEAAKLRKMAADIRPQAEAEINARNAGKVDAQATTGGGVQNVAPASIAPPGVVPPAGAASAPAGLQEAATKAWGAYDPGKYEYRIGPNGVPQRKPKGK